jgi:succinate dehydrogenase/fumarate reductase cytochrome b subunit
MFAWLFHRISGLFLIILLGIKILSGFYLFTKDKKPDWALLLHRQPMVDILIMVLLSFHVFYGIKTILYDLGIRKEKLLFWSSTVLGGVVSLLLVAIYLKVS